MLHDYRRDVAGTRRCCRRAAGAGRECRSLDRPRRADTVQLTIYNSEDLTLVRETRTVTFKKGVNPLQFSWANTLIDPTVGRAASS